MIKFYIHQAAGNYAKTLERLLKDLRTGRFTIFTQQKKQEIWRRLCRYARQSGIGIKAPIAAACMAAGLCLATPAQAQTFASTPGLGNPFNGLDIGSNSFPSFADIDNDGDSDAFIGGHYGNIYYYQNTGTATAPVFTNISGAGNPFNGVDVGILAHPVFADIDNDGDKDAFLGAYDGTIYYFKNTGTAAAPVFTATTGVSNPFNGVDEGVSSVPAFVDIDNDGDKDVFIGVYGGAIYYYKNNGTAAAPVFTRTTGAGNPLDGVNTGLYCYPTFVDVDKDGDNDAFIGTYEGTIRYYKNTGTAAAPVFTLTTGAGNPFNGEDIGIFAALAFADIDNDGDQDVFLGNYYGVIYYYRNTSPVLPLTLLNFNGSKQTGYNILAWNTDIEENTKAFNVQLRMEDGQWKTIGTVAANGSGSGSYSFNHNNPKTNKNWYRLQMLDMDGAFTYSNIILLNNTTEGNVQIRVYPNPATDMINISVGNHLLNTRFSLYNVDGRLLQNKLIKGFNVQCSLLNYPKGIYLLRFEDGTMEQVIKKM